MTKRVGGNIYIFYKGLVSTTYKERPQNNKDCD